MLTILQDPSYDPYGFAKVATRTASSLAGSAAACPANVQSFFKTIFAMAQTQSGLDDLNTQLNLCDSSKMRTATDVNATLATYVLYQWVSAVSIRLIRACGSNTTWGFAAGLPVSGKLLHLPSCIP